MYIIIFSINNIITVIIFFLIMTIILLGVSHMPHDGNIKLILFLPSQESYLQPQFLEIVQYCKSPAASYDGLLELISEDGRKE